MESLIRNHLAMMDKVDPNNEVGLMVDEWEIWYDVEPGTNPGFLFQQNNLRDAMLAAVNLNIFNNHADRVKMANIAQMVNVLQSLILNHGKSDGTNTNLLCFQNVQSTSERNTHSGYINLPELSV